MGEKPTPLHFYFSFDEFIKTRLKDFSFSLLTITEAFLYIASTLKGNMNISQKILLGVRDPKQDAIQHEINRLCRKADTMGVYARAARETFENTGRESCLSAQFRYETSQIEAKAAEWKLRQQLGEGPQ